MLKNINLFGRAALLAMVGGVCGNVANADVVAWWRFENGQLGEIVTSTEGTTIGNPGIPDLSYSGNSLFSFHHSDAHKILFVESDLPILNQSDNQLAVRASSEWPALYTWSDQSNPETDIEKMRFDEFTIEAFFQPSNRDLTGWHGIVGWDGGDVPTFIPLDEPTEPYLYYRLNIDSIGNAEGKDYASVAEIEFLKRDQNGMHYDVTTGLADRGGTITASSELSGQWNELAVEAFDDKPAQGAEFFWTTDDWLTTAPAWIQVRLDEPQSIEAFTLRRRGGNDGRVPTQVTLLGSNDGENFTEIKTASGLNWIDPARTTLYFQLPDPGTPTIFRVNYIDRAGHEHILDYPGQRQDGHWYYAAAVMDGEELRLYVSDLTEGETSPILRATQDVTTSPDPAMVPHPDFLGAEPTPRQVWTVIRGYHDSNDGDRFWGKVDEVRISNHAMDESDLLLSIGVPVEVDSFLVE